MRSTSCVSSTITRRSPIRSPPRTGTTVGATRPVSITCTRIRWFCARVFAYDESPIPSKERRTPRIPGNDRVWASLGLTYMASNTFSFDIGYSHLFINDTKINNTLESAVPTTNHTLTGEYEAEVDILSAQLNWTIE
ncbi:MAG: hypothetical protein EP300_09620 [Gammaproteobacteria bacterium]|nr:MAG: hypothetical protein EP300_09620 [Gammaproteobacteria bacterium]